MRSGRRVFSSREQLESAVGQDLGTSDWVRLDQAAIDAFAEITGDDQWIHVDPSRAAEGPYGSTIAHGYLTLSMLPAFRRTIFEIQNCRAQLNYGLNKIRFPGVVPAGSRLRAHAHLDSVINRGESSDVAVTYTIECDGSTKPVCVAESVVRVLF